MDKNDLDFWENIYKNNRQLNRYPFDCIVSFVFKSYPKNKKRENVKILELGCGAGNNLWFAAREGFDVTGVDISKTAIEYARNRFQNEDLNGVFLIGDFNSIESINDKFDIIIDRAAITYESLDEARKHIKNIKKILVKNGVMFFNPYSEKHSSCASGEYLENGMTTNIKRTFSQSDEVQFYSKRDILNLFDLDWKFESIKHIERTEMIEAEYFVEAQWECIIKKIGEEYE